jgi:hypothetical protein
MPPRKLKHDKFIFRDGGKAGRGKFDNPGATHAVGWNRETAGSFHDGGKLQLHAGERKPQSGFGGTIMMIAAAGGVMSVAFIRVAFKRRDDERAGQVGAQDGEQKEFTLGLDLGQLCQIWAEMSFGEQVRKEVRHAARDRTQGCDEPAGAALGTVRVA